MKQPNLSDAVKKQAEQATDGEWRTVKDIWNRVGEWAPGTIKRALKELAAEGRIERRNIPPSHPALMPRAEYRRGA